MRPTTVAHDEWLYRRIRSDMQEYAIVEGAVRFSANAFNDREFKPSVDRSTLRANPADMKLDPSDGIAKCLAESIRNRCDIPIDGAAFDKVRERPHEQAALERYAVDVLHRPILRTENEAENLAHCQIETAPVVRSATRFKKLKEALARIADEHGFVVEPEIPQAG